MDQIKIGKFIAEQRHKEKLTQKQLAEKLNVSDRAVSKWERGVCLMDISLLKPLSSLLNVSVIDLLSGEIVPESKRNERYEESIADIAYMNEMKSKAFGVNGFLFAYLFFIIYKVVKDIYFYDIISILMFFLSFKFYYLYQLDHNRTNKIMSWITLATGLFLLLLFLCKTW